MRSLSPTVIPEMISMLFPSVMPRVTSVCVGVAVGEVVVFTITEIAGRLQLKLSGSISGFTRVPPH